MTHLLSLRTLLGGAAVAALVATAAPTGAAPPPKGISLEPIGTYVHGGFEVSSSEIVAHDPVTQRLFVVNATPEDEEDLDGPSIDILDMSDPTEPTLVEKVDVGGTPNSVDVHDGLVAVAVENDVKDQRGWVVFLDTDGNELNRVTVGALPDMLTFTPDGNQVVVANEGEPFAGFEGLGDSYKPERDPVGSISILDVSNGAAEATLTTADFEEFNDQREALLADGVRLNPAVPSVAQDLEPEYVTVSDDSKTAWAALQENNAIAEIDLIEGEVTRIFALGRKDHSKGGNGLDVSDEDGKDGSGAARIRPRNNVYGIHMPDGIASTSIGGQTYILTANEGDARAYTGLTDESRVRNLRDITGAEERFEALCEKEFPNRKKLIEESDLGRLTVSTIDGYDIDRNCFSELHAFGTRSFSIWTTDGDLVFDSGDEFEKVALKAHRDFFNSDHSEASFDNRSDNKGPEPEGIAVEEIDGHTYAFIGLERIGGVMTYDISDPFHPVRVDYVNNRDYAAQLAGDDPGDLGAEGITVITGDDSPTGAPLVVVANEVSGTTTIFAVRPS